MSLQDDIFDIEAELVNKPELLKAFEKIIQRMGEYEVKADKWDNFVSRIRATVQDVIEHPEQW